MFTLKYNKKDVLRYAGYSNMQVDDTATAEIEEVSTLVSKQSNFNVVYKVFDIVKSDKIVVKDSILAFEGSSIMQLLSQSDKCVLMAVTLGSGVDELLRKLQVSCLSKAVLADCVASSMVENLCDQLEEQIKNEWTKKGMFLTDRFSPGYGDLSLKVQAPFCDVLDASKRIGLNVTDSGLLTPKKSITAIVGISDTPQPMRIKGCKYCSLAKNCVYKKRGSKCSN